MSARLRFCAALLTVLVPTIAAGQAAPARDNAAAPTGTALLLGAVMTDEPVSKPVRRARVTVSAGVIGAPRSTITDDAGRFAVDGLAAGNYTLQVAKPGFVSSFYGSKRVGRGPGVPIAVSAGQRVTDLVVKIQRGGVITGTIRQQSGLPAANVPVLVGQVDIVNGRRRAAITSSLLGTATTDDRGVYRVFGLVPGDYVVGVQPQPGSAATDLRTVTPSEVRWAEQVIASRGGRGTAPPPAPAPGQTVTYTPVYFPGTISAGEATLVTVGAGEERSAVDFITTLVPTAKISGTILDGSGQPGQDVRLSLSAIESIELTGSAADVLSRLIGQGVVQMMPDGRFTVSGVAPGRYTLSARAAARGAGPAGGPGTGRGGLPNSAVLASPLLAAFVGGTTTLWSNEEIVVAGRDVNDLTMRLQPGMTVSGRVVYDATSAAPPPDVTRTTVLLAPATTGTNTLSAVTSMLSGMTTAQVAADGTFTLKGLAPSTYRLTAAGGGLLAAAAAQAGGGAAGGWFVKSAMVNGRDVADRPIEIRPNEDLSDLVVTLTDRHTELSGALTDQAGRPTSAFPIVVFSTDRAFWSLGSRRVQQVRPSTNGRYRTTVLPPGEYYLAAVTDLDPNDLYDPQFLEQLAPTAIKIALGDGATTTQDLRLGGQ